MSANEFLSTVVRFSKSGYKWARWAIMFISRNVNDFVYINGHYLAAAIAFYGFLSLFPLSIALITLSRILIGIEGFEQRLIEGLLQQFPTLKESPDASFVENFIHNVSDNNAITSSLTGLALFIAGLGVFGSIRKSVNIIWGIHRPRPFLIERAIDLILMLGASAFLFLSVMLSALLTFLGVITEFLFPEAPNYDTGFLRIIAIAAPPFITYCVFAVIYWWLPNTRVRFVEISGVALLAAVAFEIAKYAFIFFLRNSGSQFSSVYGSISTIMMFFFFVYVEAIILLAGAMLSAKWANYLRVREQRRQNDTLMENLRRINQTSHLPFVPLNEGSRQQTQG